MNLKRARYIKAIYEAGGATAAAKKLFVSQPSLSQTVRLVEQELGIAIFERGVSPPKLTYAGEKYLETARAMIAQEEQLNSILEDIRNEEQGYLRLGVSIQRGMQLLPLVLPEFSRRYPDVQLLLEERGSELLEKNVEEGKLDLALVTTEPSCNKLKYILIENESYVLLSSWEGPLSGRCKPGDSVSLMDIANERFVSLKPGPQHPGGDGQRGGGHPDHSGLRLLYAVPPGLCPQRPGHRRHRRVLSGQGAQRGAALLRLLSAGEVSAGLYPYLYRDGAGGHKGEPAPRASGGGGGVIAPRLQQL